MKNKLPIFLFLFAVLSAGCGKSDNKGLNEQRRILSEGYSMLYADAAKFDMAELVLYVKAESEKMNEIITAISEFGDELKNDLERLAKAYPGVRIDLNPLPEMEERKRAAIGKDLAIYFLPIVGKGGREYELRTLLGLYNGLNHESHLCRVMADEETDENLKKFLLNCEKSYASLRNRVAALLEKEYLRAPVP